jgi:hypothetical protein
LHGFSSIPSYSFDFGGGITSPTGIVIRQLTGPGPNRTDQFEYRFNDIALARLATPLHSEYADLLDVACAVWVADRWSPRTSPNDARQPADRWHRRLSLTIPVRNIEIWSPVHIADQLAGILHYLTDDHWSFEFVPRTSMPRPSEIQSALPCAMPPGDAIASLFSGGLDSCLGLINNARSDAASSLIATSVVSNHRLHEVQSQVLKGLQPYLGPELASVRVTVGVAGGDRHRSARESSQRSRGFLYLTVGTVVSMMIGSPILHLCENGIGAINLPYDMAHTGARNTKAVHPLTLQRYVALATNVLGAPIQIKNSGLWSTKAQLCSELLSEDLYSAAKRTVTCDRFPWVNARDACGRCTSCLLRRASLMVSGHAALDTLSYEFDALKGSSMSRAHNETVPLYAMCIQVERLRNVVGSPDPKSSFINEFPDLMDVVVGVEGLSMSRGEVMSRLASMYQTYVDEWDFFMSQITALSELRTMSNSIQDNESTLAIAS